ncbi:hypothetical protein EV401DRAFT_1222540 [Pisolithus croceorrhizus]|nr:hypothetical protein EV401DRAFT_1222540 [Pisolithus croceorrhizus]
MQSDENDRRPDGARNISGAFRQVYFGRRTQIVEGTARSIIRTFDVKKREYFGNMSMEDEISLLMANRTQASTGKLIYDPFIGTGSVAYVFLITLVIALSIFKISDHRVLWHFSVWF